MSVVRLKIPTKITLFGEHAVVYGVPAIATTLPVYISISGEKIGGGIIRINVGKSLQTPIYSVILSRDRISIEPDQDHMKKVLSYILTAIDVCEEYIGITQEVYGYSIAIDSPLPVSVGLGTSAAVSVGTVTLCLALNNQITDLENSKYDIAKLAWSVEKIVQGSASPMDTYTIALGGLRYIEPSAPMAHLIDIDYELPIVVGFTSRTHTTAELVRKVKELRERNEGLFKEILKIIGKIVEEAKKALINQDLEGLGMLMNMNHGILQSLGIVSIEHNIIAHMLKNVGALGVKTSGAGGGGAFVALAKSKESQERLATVAESLGAKIISRSICQKGVEILR